MEYFGSDSKAIKVATYIRKRMIMPNVKCPKCKSNDVVIRGYTKSGAPHYYCRECRKQWNSRLGHNRR